MSSLIEKVASFIHEQQLFTSSHRLLLAVSGGMDSMVMLNILNELDYEIGVAHCNFGLRGEASDEDEALVRRVAEDHQLPFYAKRFDVEAYRRGRNQSVQMAAREMRYQWFDELIETEGYDRIVLAHHLNDQVETFFINLSRGSGVSGLRGMLPLQGVVARPLLCVYRIGIQEWALSNNIAYREDSSNQSDDYLRNRIRHHLVPVLDQLDPHMIKAITHSMNHLVGVEKHYLDRIDQLRDELLKENDGVYRLDTEGLQRQGFWESLLYELLAPFGFNPTQLQELASGINQQPGAQFRSSDYELTRDRGQLLIRRLDPSNIANREIRVGKAEQRLEQPCPMTWELLAPMPESEWRQPKNIACLDWDKLEESLIFRTWKDGDGFHPLGMKRRKKLSDYFVDRKYTLYQKRDQWLLISGEHIVWVVGERIDDRYKVTANTKRILKITIN